MNILTRNFASTRPVQIATWTYKRYNLIVIFASTRPVQIATQCASRTVRVQAFASTRSVQIATVKSIGNRLHTIFASTRSVQIATSTQFCFGIRVVLCLHTLRADCNTTFHAYDKSREVFASTRSVQIATAHIAEQASKKSPLPPHAPCRLQRQKCTELQYALFRTCVELVDSFSVLNKAMLR